MKNIFRLVILGFVALTLLAACGKDKFVGTYHIADDKTNEVRLFITYKDSKYSINLGSGDKKEDRDQVTTAVKENNTLVTYDDNQNKIVVVELIDDNTVSLNFFGKTLFTREK